MTENGLYRQHRDSCKQGKKYGRIYGRGEGVCDCPIWYDQRRDGVRTHHALGTNHWPTAVAAVEGNQIVRTPGQKTYRFMVGNDGLIPYAVETAPARVSLASAIEKFAVFQQGKNLEESSLIASGCTLKTFSAYCPAGLFVDQIDAETFDGYREARKQKKVAPSTLGKELRHLRTFWRLCEKRGWSRKIEDDGTFAPPKDNSHVSKKGFEPEDITKILAAVSTLPDERNRLRAKALLLTGLHTGLAAADLAQLSRKEIDSTGRYTSTRQKIKSASLNILLPAEVLEALATLPVEHEDYYFWSGRGRWQDCSDRLRMLIKKVYRAAGVDWTRQPFHKLRHSNSAAMRDAHVPSDIAAKRLGHKSARTLEQYYSGEMHADRDRLDAVTDKLSFGLPPGE